MFVRINKGLENTCRFLVVLSGLLVLGCASVEKLPTSAAEVAFTDHVSGTPKSREHDQCLFYNGVKADQALEAAKYSFIRNKFSVKKASIAGGVITAEHGMTSRDWNIVAGIYFREVDNKGIAVKTMVKMAVTTSLYQADNITAKDWVGRLSHEFTSYLRRGSAVTLTTSTCGGG